MFRRRRTAEDFAEEIKTHIELEADVLRGEGLDGQEARPEARLAFGNVRVAQERFLPEGPMGGDSFYPPLFTDAKIQARSRATLDFREQRGRVGFDCEPRSC
jgi:hypothetical protein